MAASLLEIVQGQAAEIDRLRAKIEILRGFTPLQATAPAKCTITRKHRARLRASWTPERCEAQSGKLKDLWQLRRMEAATDPNLSFYRNGDAS